MTTTTPTPTSASAIWRNMRAQGFRTMFNAEGGGNWHLRLGDLWLSGNHSPDTGETEVSIGRRRKHWLVLLLGPEFELLASAHGSTYDVARHRCHESRAA